MSDILWAEGAAPGEVVDPGAPLRTSGYGPNEIPAHEHFNWLFQQYGRAAIRKFDAAEDLIASLDEVGIVLPSGGLGTYMTPDWQLDWLIAGDATETEICSDGEYLWTIADTGAHLFVRRRLRSTGAVDLDQAAGTWPFYRLISCAGGNVYALRGAFGAKPRLMAFDRATLAFLYEVALPAIAVARAVATDGYYIAVAADNIVHLYQDTGAALSAIGTYDHTAQVNAICMNGDYLVLGGATPGAADQVKVLSYGAGGFVHYSTIDRAGNPQALKVARVDELIAHCGDIDTADYTGVWRSKDNRTLRWAAPFAANDVAIVDGLVVEAGNGTIRFRDAVDGEIVKILVWDSGAATAVNRLAYDNDALFVLGAVTAGGHRLKRYSMHSQPKLFRTLDPATAVRRRYTSGVPSLIQPIR